MGERTRGLRLLEPVLVATENEDKFREVRLVLRDHFREAPRQVPVRVAEDTGTLLGNALQKARAAAAATGATVVADDTALEVDALDGRPGLLVARYASRHGGGLSAVSQLLEEVRASGRPERTARFRCVAVCVVGDRDWSAEGVCEGALAEVPDATAGFTFDAVFVPAGCDVPLAALDPGRLLMFSHRAKAFRDLMARLEVIPG